jgi:hypothetical protein
MSLCRNTCELLRKTLNISINKLMDKGLFDGLDAVLPDKPTRSAFADDRERVNKRTRELMRECVSNIVDICVVRNRDLPNTQRNYEELLAAIDTKSKDVIVARFDGFTTTLEYRRKYSDAISRSLTTFRDLINLLV